MHGTMEPPPAVGAASSVAFPEPDATIAEAAGLPAKLQMRFAAWLRVCGQLDRAATMLDAAESQFGESAAILDERATLALASGDASQTRTSWERRLAAYPAPSARAAFARALLELGELEEASGIAEELLAEHGELATVRSLAADVALQQGDLATAHDYWQPQLTEDDSRIMPLLAITRISLLSGDLDEARSCLDRALTNPSTLTAAQLASAAGLAELLGQPVRAQNLRLQYARQEASRAALLAAEIDTALGRANAITSQPNGHPRNPGFSEPTTRGRAPRSSSRI